MSIINVTKNTTIALQGRVAKTPWARMKGLLGDKDMPAGYALIITGCQSIHMMFMAFPIDVVFIDKNNVVVGLSSNIPPFAFSPIFWKSSCAIELRAGTIQLSNTAIGDSLKISFPDWK